MVRDEAPAATIGGFNGRECDRTEIGSAGQPAQFQETVRPASLLRKSILDINQRASSAAGCNATFKLRATAIRK
jgi:hypothetical protein